jgi:hypothetical protein
MSVRFRARIAGSLAAIFLAISAAGEGLHYLPGCGHAVELPGGYLFLGLSIQRSPNVGQRPTGVGQPRGAPIPLRDAGTCAICEFFAHSPSPTANVTAVPALDLLGHLALPVRVDVDLVRLLPAQARGPPAA